MKKTIAFLSVFIMAPAILADEFFPCDTSVVKAAIVTEPSPEAGLVIARWEIISLGSCQPPSEAPQWTLTRTYNETAETGPVTVTYPATVYATDHYRVWFRPDNLGRYTIRAMFRYTPQWNTTGYFRRGPVPDPYDVLYPGD